MPHVFSNFSTPSSSTRHQHNYNNMEDSTKRGLIQQLAMLQNTSKHSPDSPLPDCKTPGTGDQMIYPNAPLQPTPSGSPVLSAYHLGQPSPSAQTHLEASTIATPSTQNSKIYSPSSLSAQITPIYSPNLANAHSIASISPYMNASHQNTSSPSQYRQPTLQSPYQPTQRSLPPGLTSSPSFGSTSQGARHFNTDPLQRHYPQTQTSHVQPSRGLNQARHHPYGSPSNRGSHTSQALPHGLPQPQPRAGTSTPQCVYSERPESSRAYNGALVSSLPPGTASSRGPRNMQQSHRLNASHLPTTSRPTTPQPRPHGPPQFYLPPGASQPSLPSQSSPGPLSNTFSSSVFPSSPAAKLQPPSSLGASQSHVREMPQAFQSKLPQTPPPPREQPRARVWADWLEIVADFEVQLQAESYEDGTIEKQKALLKRVQEHSLSKLRAHEFLENVTLDYNALFKPSKVRIFDFYIMQALLFNGDFVLLVSSRTKKSPCIEPPQSFWHAYDLSKYRHHAEIELHMHTTLNRITNLIPDELVLCPGYERHDSPVNAVNKNGDVQYGWSTTLCYEVKLSDPLPKLLNLSAEFMVHSINRKHIKDIKNMDPMWKAKILDIFKAREESEDALQNMRESWC
ncbi:hypothetical protein D6C80_00967 [Aureobasidium pullulans]|nr:hypothetical protein D6C80_00967 [Aureobasidium pullulans]